jgi:hypothetical protein
LVERRGFVEVLDLQGDVYDLRHAATIVEA